MPLGADRALATLVHAGTTVSLEFRFNADDEVVGIYTPARWGSFDGGYRLPPREGRFAGYARIDGVRVPTRGEVGWHRDGQWRPVWRGSVVTAAFEFE